MEIHYEYDIDDWLDAHRAYINRKPGYRFLWIVGAACLVSSIPLFLWQRLLGVWFIVMGIYFLSYPLVVFPMRIKRDFKKQTQFHGPLVLKTTENDLVATGKNFRSEYKWDFFASFRETKRIFMLYVSDKNFLVVPKRAFASRQLDEFRVLLALHMHGTERKKTSSHSSAVSDQH
jgi:hypothetical protein